jgi:hypothetical protein
MQGCEYSTCKSPNITTVLETDAPKVGTQIESLLWQEGENRKRKIKDSLKGERERRMSPWGRRGS